MKINPNVVSLIDQCAPLWAAEAEIVRLYWDSPVRTVETDRLWLLRQMYKELWDGFYPSFKWLNENFDHMESGATAGEMMEEIEVLQEEFVHYVGFAQVYQALSRPLGVGNPNPKQLRALGDWPENVALMQLRAGHVRDHGPVGKRAHRFTEGGYCTLYAEGMKLKERGGVDGQIADACTVVYEDEFDHMLRGIADLAGSEQPLTDQDWRLLAELAVEQSRSRLRMRNAQFSFPVGEEQMAAFSAGACAPVAFDYERAFGKV